jgi:hypothetical protein
MGDIDGVGIFTSEKVRKMTKAATETRKIIEARIDGLTPDIPVRDFEMRNIEAVLEDVDLDARLKFPGEDEESRWSRVQFYKDELLTRFAVSLRPRLSAVFHQYVAACIRGGRGSRSYTIDDSGCVDLIPAAVV